MIINKITRLWISRILPWLAPLLALGCYDPDPIETAAVSPDSQFVAVTTKAHELGVLDLTRDDPMRILSRQAGTGLAWTSDSRKLIFVHQPSGAPSSLRIADVASGKEEPTLLGGPGWKGSPVCLADGRVAFIGDAEAKGVGVWTVSLRDRSVKRLFAWPLDPSRLWAAPAGDALVFQTSEPASDVLWLWRLEGGDPIRLAQLNPGAPALDPHVTFSADGGRIAFCALRAGHPELVWFDLAARTVLDRLTLEHPAAGLSVTRDGLIAAGQANAAVLWRPKAGWYQRSVAAVNWNEMPLGVLGTAGSGGLVLALNRNCILMLRNARRPESGRVHSRRMEDLLALAFALVQKDHPKQARDLLAGLQSRVPKGSRPEYLLTMAWAHLDRSQGRWRPADQWIAHALQAATPGGPEEEAAWLERLALAAFGAKDRPMANWIMEKMPGGLDKTPLASWTKQLMESGDTKSMRTWMEIGGDLRSRNEIAAAHLVAKALDESDPGTITLQGVSLILGGGFEPVGEAGDIGQRRIDTLMGLPEFQNALQGMMRRNLVGGPTPAELGSLLFGQWVRQGDFNSARQLVRETLKEPADLLPEYQEMLRRFLVLEETDRWLQRAVTDALLNKEIAETISERLTSPEDRLTLRLAQIKKALMEGEPQSAQAWLTDAQALEARVRASAGDAADDFDRSQTTFLTLLFKTKAAERNHRWTAAIQGYEDCRALIEKAPGSWEVSPFEVAFAAELLRLGSARDPDLLNSYLTVLRGAGDPLINPSHDPSTIQVALSNLATLHRVAPEHWIQPYLSYAEGLYYSLSQQSWRALSLLERARGQNPPPALLQRILLEEAANRDTLGQHALAAGLYRQIYAMDGAAAQRAQAIQAAIQSETACGVIKSPNERLKEVLKDGRLPRKWREWLWVQQGTDSQ